MNSQHFAIGPDGFKELQKNILIRLLSLFVVVVIVVFLVPFMTSETSEGISTSSWLTLLLGLCVFAFSYFNNLKKQKAMLATYKLIVNEDSVTREMLNTPTISLLKSEIREIVKGANGSFSIIADSKINAIGVSAQIERKDELEQLLAAIKPITVKTSTPLLQKFQFPIALLIAGLMFVTFYVDNKYISSLCGVVFSVVVIYSIIVIQKSKNIDTRTKRLSYFILIPLLSVIFSVIMKWML